MMTKPHINILDSLRGLAAFMVVLCHYSGYALPTIRPNAYSDLFYFGRYGVDIFFVISGMVIPYSMYKSRYHFRDFGNYIIKRFLRVNPPYYIALALSVGLYFSSILIKGSPIEGMIDGGITWTTIVGHITYIAPYIGQEWLTPVFWTLAIEFQFYVLIGLSLTFLLKGTWQFCLIAGSFIALGFIPAFSFFAYCTPFILGILLFLKFTDQISLRPFIIISFLTVVGMYIQMGFSVTFFGVSTFIIIFFIPSTNYALLKYLGKISYSLYLTHWVVGNSLEIIIKRMYHPPYNVLETNILFAFYLCAAIVFAHLFYMTIEKMFIKYAQNWVKPNKV